MKVNVDVVKNYNKFYGVRLKRKHSTESVGLRSFYIVATKAIPRNITETINIICIILCGNYLVLCEKDPLMEAEVLFVERKS